MKGNGVIIIAEAGVNHNGDINIAKKLIEVAADCNVDYIKFQTWITEDLIDISAPKANYQLLNDGSENSQYEMLKKLELSYDDFRELKLYSESKGVNFLSTPDEEKSLDFLCDDLGLELIKIGSGEITNIPFLRKVGKKKKKVILSTGMANLGEVERACDALYENGAKEVILLHCTSNYPAKLETVNLKAMVTLRDSFKLEVGYSDHTEGFSVSIAAVALGAVVIEKHFTIDKEMKGPDHKASMDPLELNNFVTEIRNVELALKGDGRKRIQEDEVNTKSVVTKGLYINKKLFKGSLLNETNLILKRPNNGVPANYFDLLLGKKLNKDKFSGDFITFSDIDFE
uniref:N-acetylneuraminate synthase n=1 Tax=Flavobacterium sp. TaxID=239 RepID=UPI00404A68A0